MLSENIQLTSCTYTSNSSYTEGSNSNSCFISTESFNVNTITNAELNVTPGIAKDSQIITSNVDLTTSHSNTPQDQINVIQNSIDNSQSYDVVNLSMVLQFPDNYKWSDVINDYNNDPAGAWGPISIYELADPQGAYIIAAGNDGLLQQ